MPSSNVQYYLLDVDTETVIGGPYEDWRAARAARSDGETIATGHSLTELVPELRTDIDLSWDVGDPHVDDQADEAVEKLLTDGGAEAAAVSRHTRRAVCQDCDRDWEGSAYQEVGEAHAARYDHRVDVVERIVYDGPEANQEVEA